MNTGFYDFARRVMKPVYGLLFPARTDGVENIPEEGGFILCSNHVSNRDPFYLAVRVPNRRLHYMAKAELFRFRPLAAFLKAFGAFPVDRGRNDMTAVRTAINLLKEGRGLGIFPQGTRSKKNVPTPMYSGTSLFALRTGMPVIPAYIGGPYHLFRRMKVRFGKPVDLSEFGRKMDGETLTRATKKIEDAIWGMRED